VSDFATEREEMVERHLRRRGIGEQPILDAFLAVPREQFVAPDLAYLAYGDHPLPIAAGQTISQPFIVALMIQAAGVKAGDRVLEVGAGSGFAAAVLSRIAASVVAVERQPELVEIAAKRLARLGFDNVTIAQGDGTTGWPAEAPYDAILVAASGSHVPPALVEQLRVGGRIVMPLGGPGGSQDLVRVTKLADGSVEQDSLGGVRFVPLIGAAGWSEA
jgi:protein-L-isoaspartate(D-aspartate) O-methyltransferase